MKLKYTKEITFSLLETETGVTVKDVTYFIMLTKQNEVLFDITSQRDDGVFVLKLHTTEENKTMLQDRNNIWLDIEEKNNTLQSKTPIDSTSFSIWRRSIHCDYDNEERIKMKIIATARNIIQFVGDSPI